MVYFKTTEVVFIFIFYGHYYSKNVLFVTTKWSEVNRVGYFRGFVMF